MIDSGPFAKGRFRPQDLIHGHKTQHSETDLGGDGITVPRCSFNRYYDMCHLILPTVPDRDSEPVPVTPESNPVAYLPEVPGGVAFSNIIHHALLNNTRSDGAPFMAGVVEIAGAGRRTSTLSPLAYRLSSAALHAVIPGRSYHHPQSHKTSDPPLPGASPAVLVTTQAPGVA